MPGIRREKRNHPRGFSTYRVTYGIDQPEHRALARRLSPTGLFIATNGVVFSEGIELIMDLEIAGMIHRLRGVVRYSMKVDPRLVRILKPGMGVRFDTISEEVKAAILAGR